MNWTQHNRWRRPERTGAGGFTLIEAVVVLLIVSLMISLVMMDVVGVFRRQELKEDIGRFSQTLSIAAEQAVFSRTTYLVVIEVMDGYYTVYEDLGDGRYDEFEPLLETDSLNRFYIETIEFEDGSKQYSGEVILRATAQGWESSVLFSLLDDENDRQSYLRCDRLTTRNVVSNLPLDFFWPLEEVSMSDPI